MAEIAGQYLNKGSQIYIEGKLQTRNWQTKEGQDCYTTEIVVSEMQMLGGKTESQPVKETNQGSKQIDEIDIPFGDNASPNGNPAWADDLYPF